MAYYKSGWVGNKAQTFKVNIKRQNLIGLNILYINISIQIVARYFRICSEKLT